MNPFTLLFIFLGKVSIAKLAGGVSVAAIVWAYILENSGLNSLLVPLCAAFFGSLTVVLPAYLKYRYDRRQSLLISTSQSQHEEVGAQLKVAELTADERQELRELMSRMIEEQRAYYVERDKQKDSIIATQSGLIDGYKNLSVAMTTLTGLIGEIRTVLLKGVVPSE